MKWARSVLSRGEAETRLWGSRVARAAPRHAIVALIGELGAGKTQFAAGAAAACGYAGHVRSPTFTLMNLYGRTDPVYHFDLYRLPFVGELELAEWEEYWDAGRLSLIEWADRLGNDLAPRALRITLAHRGGNLRRIVFEARPGVWDRLRGHLEGEDADAYPRN